MFPAFAVMIKQAIHLKTLAWSRVRASKLSVSCSAVITITTICSRPPIWWMLKLRPGVAVFWEERGRGRGWWGVDPC